MRPTVPKSFLPAVHTAFFHPVCSHVNNSFAIFVISIGSHSPRILLVSITASGYIHFPLQSYILLTAPARRKIRAYYRGKKCNAPFRLILMRPFRPGPCQSPAVLCDNAVQLVMVGTLFLRICTQNAYFIKNTYTILLGSHRNFCTSRVQSIKNEAAIGSGQTVLSHRTPPSSKNRHVRLSAY